MLSRKKVVAGLGGLTLLLGTLGGGIAISAAGPKANTPVIEKASTGPDTDNVQSGSGAQVQSGTQVEDGTPDVPGAVSP